MATAFSRTSMVANMQLTTPLTGVLGSPTIILSTVDFRGSVPVSKIIWSIISWADLKVIPGCALTTQTPMG